jgi:hypothetical protein
VIVSHDEKSLWLYTCMAGKALRRIEDHVWFEDRWMVSSRWDEINNVVWTDL